MVHAREDYNHRVQDSQKLIPADEPVFLIRAQDALSFETVMYWAKRCRNMGNGELADHVEDHAFKMRDWPNKKKQL